MDEDHGFQRRMRAIADAHDDEAIGKERLTRVRGEISELDSDELELLATMHLLFNDEVPSEEMRSFWLRRRIAAEILRSRQGSGPLPSQST